MCFCGHGRLPDGDVNTGQCLSVYVLQRRRVVRSRGLQHVSRAISGPATKQAPLQGVDRGPDLDEVVVQVVRADMRREASVRERDGVAARVVAEDDSIGEVVRIGLAFQADQPCGGDPVAWKGVVVHPVLSATGGAPQVAVGRGRSVSMTRRAKQAGWRTGRRAAY